MHAEPSRPRLALLLGDPAGIGPELAARLLADPATHRAAQVLVIGAPEVAQAGLQAAGVQLPLDPLPQMPEAHWQAADAASASLLAMAPPGADHAVGRSSAAGGHYILQSLRLALQAHARGAVDAIVFAPLNKHSLHLARMGTEDELRWFAQELRHTGATSEFNVLDGLWTSRVTSHIALAEVPRHITHAGIVQAIGLLHAAIRASGIAAPRVAVCGLNPHNGDNGSFGREEIDIIAPGVQAANAQGLHCEGPFAADTIFLKVQGEARQYDGIVTMYHDQGQIAMKLMGFWRGVTVQGGLPVPICTPAHGTAYDIAGQGRAHPGAMQQAFALACRMARQAR